MAAKLGKSVNGMRAESRPIEVYENGRLY